ncbi:hypothetical protein SAMN05444483_11629 [Salegentibacter echinorum]|uniref:Lipocalin-like domain-containing protein n=1 Tax=Salegentibacter echinorum TaxID=1073325 RepID=A0A1M5KSE3_SALEC|nr:hypothetical protein [Salegentibacter echinorum]SHG55782.1 hypothetical protein SAMN05444483_11629 [Salegentibacter echinorum]
MRTFKTLLLAISLAISFIFCVNKESQNNGEKGYTNVQLFGKWAAVSSSESSNKKGSKIESIRFVNDSIAKIQLIDSAGERIINGTWENGFEKNWKSSGLVFKSDIGITYYPNKQNKTILLLKIFEKNKKIIMSGNELQFEKE